MIEKVFFAVLVLTVAVIVVKGLKRKRPADRGQEQEHPHNPGGGDPWHQGW